MYTFRQLSVMSEEDFRNDLVQKICGILDVNTFEVRPPEERKLVIKNPELECLRGIS